MTVPSDEDYDPSMHLSVQDIAVDNSQYPLFSASKSSNP